MRVLVVDDQRLSRAGIIKMIDWSGLGLRLAGECANGYEALDRMSDLEVDIVITDVRMPALGGLEMIEQAKELYPHVAFLVISGFDDYAYIRKSLHLSVTDYLLKPVDRQELNGILETLIAKTQDGRQKAAVHLQKTREQFFRLLLEGAYEDERQVAADWDDIRLPETYDRFVVAMFDSDDDKDALYRRLRPLADRCEIFLLRMRGHTYTLVVAGPADAMEPTIAGLRTELGDRNTFHLAGVGTPASGIERLRDSANRAHDAYMLQASLPETADRGDPASHAMEDGQPISFFLNSAWEREWFLLIKQGRRAAIVRKLEDLLDEAANPGMRRDPIESVYPYMLLRGARALYESGAIDEPSYIEAFQIAKKLPYVVELEAKREVVADFFVRRLDAGSQLPAQKAKEIVEKAKAFIDANFHQTINLTDLAQTYYMNPGYFSTLFRQFTGCNFLEYLTQLRMEHAKALIAGNPSCKIATVAQLCGYQDLKHFRKLFKRYSGVTPLQYKEETKVD